MRITTNRRTALGLIGATLTATPKLAFAQDRWLPRETVAITTATGRITQVTHWTAPRQRGTILFSHGAKSSPRKYDALILPWVAAGYDVWAPLHVDSPDHPDTKKFTGYAPWRARIEDMRALSQHIGDKPRIAAGHSYGALVALTLGGAAADVPEGLTGPLNDPLVSSVVAFSPPPPIKGLISRDGYATLNIPALIETGTLDVLPGAPAGPDAYKGHLVAYDATAPGHDHYAMVLDGVNHFFGGMICWSDQPGPPQTAQMAIAGEISRLFLDAYGSGDRKARLALDSRLGTHGALTLSKK
jgi:pimeloyl-ACP methyl ester carboxylesterase